MVPAWLHIVSQAALALGSACALVLAIDIARHPQRMGIMNVVWPVNALFGTVPVAWAYFRRGRATHRQTHVNTAQASGKRQRQR